MLENFIIEKGLGKELSQTDYYLVISYIMKHGIDHAAKKFFLCLNSFGMSKREILYLTMAIRDSGRVLRFNRTILEKHSTGGVADSTSLVLIPLLACLGYKVIKTTARSFVFTNGSADRFGAIPNFKTKLDDEEISECLYKTNACVLSHKGDMCPADKILFDLRESLDIEDDLNLMAASIAAKKLASGASIVLVDIKYGEAAIIKTYFEAKKMAGILKYIFTKCGVKPIIILTDTLQTIGEGIGNALEVVDALDVLRGKKCVLRDVSIKFAYEMILKANPYIKRKDLIEMLNLALDNGSAYNRFLEIIQMQGGDVKAVDQGKIFKPYKTVNFVSEKDGYVGSINSLLMGELIRRLCQDSHDNNIGAVIRVKIGDFIKKGDVIVSFFYKNKEDFEKYRNAISGCIRITDQEIKPIKIVKEVIR